MGERTHEQALKKVNTKYAFRPHCIMPQAKCIKKNLIIKKLALSFP